MNTTTTLASDYAGTIEQTLRAVEGLTDVPCVVFEDYAEDPTPATLADHGHDDLDPELLMQLNDLAESGYLADHDGDIAAAWIDSTLEVRVHGSRILGGEWNETAVEVLVTFGGPDARVTADDRDELTVAVHWGSDHAERRVYAPNLAAAIFELTEYA